MSRCRRLATLLVIAAQPALSLHAAQTDPARAYPSKPIRFIVPYSAGGATDITARVIGAKLAEKWGQQVVVDNRTGAGGAIGVEYTANATPDGYTICLFSASQTTATAAGQKLPYDLLKDLQPISLAITVGYVVYHSPKLPITSVGELIAHAKANPGKLNYGTSGIGSLQHLAGALMSHLGGIKVVPVQYKGSANIVQAMMAGEVQFGFNSMFSVRPHVQAGRLRWIATTGAKRSPPMELPTVAETLPGFEVTQWYGLITGARVPRPIVQKISAAAVEAVRSPDASQRLTADGSEIVGSTPEQFGAHIRSEIAKWGKLVKEANLSLQ
ncbi:MAG TPA: tripartite tricarboxylate transporter substrate binding protein [Burkholderiales bacterium]|nr:tripartite tricarboxylate transporter substrate binding protein [Burkholderiales bacterium]